MIAKHRKTIVQILNRQDPRLLVVCGPCSIHDKSAALDYARALKQLSHSHREHLFVVMRTYFAKPRTQGGWKGFISDPHLDGSGDIQTGIKLARQLLEDISALNLPCATEFLNPFMPAYFSDLISWAAIGARTVESQLHRELASHLSMPIAFKNNTAGDIQSAVDGCLIAKQPHAFLGIQGGKVQVIHSKGNPNSHIILRGSKTRSNYERESVANALTMLEKARLPKRLMIDCSHGNSGGAHLKQVNVARFVTEQIAEGNRHIVGIMLESNLVSGKQRLSDPLTYGKSITDACVDLKDTEKIFELLSSACFSANSRML